MDLELQCAVEAAAALTSLANAPVYQKELTQGYQLPVAYRIPNNKPTKLVTV